MRTKNQQLIQGMTIGRGDAVSPYTVQENDRLVEFTEAGTVTCTIDGADTSTTVLAGTRYAINLGVTVIAFTGSFSIG